MKSFEKIVLDSMACALTGAGLYSLFRDEEDSSKQIAHFGFNFVIGTIICFTGMTITEVVREKRATKG